MGKINLRQSVIEQTKKLDESLKMFIYEEMVRTKSVHKVQISFTKKYSKLFDFTPSYKLIRCIYNLILEGKNNNTVPQASQSIDVKDITEDTKETSLKNSTSRKNNTANSSPTLENSQITVRRSRNKSNKIIPTVTFKKCKKKSKKRLSRLIESQLVRNKADNSLLNNSSSLNTTGHSNDKENFKWNAKRTLPKLSQSDVMFHVDLTDIATPNKNKSIFDLTVIQSSSPNVASKNKIIYDHFDSSPIPKKMKHDSEIVLNSSDDDSVQFVTLSQTMGTVDGEQDHNRENREKNHTDVGKESGELSVTLTSAGSANNENITNIDLTDESEELNKRKGSSNTNAVSICYDLTTDLNDDFRHMSKKSELLNNLAQSVFGNSYRLRGDDHASKRKLNRYGSNIYNPRTSDAKRKTGPRMIVIDGSNVAMGHGQNKKKFSVEGLKICIDYFLKRGHEVKAFVPRFRNRATMSTNPRLLEELEQSGHVVYTPSRRVQNRNITSYDDRYIIQCAAEYEAVVVSGDNFRDLYNENVSWRETIEKRLLPFTWVGDMLMFPQDPLGRNGPKLNEFLHHT